MADEKAPQQSKIMQYKELIVAITALVIGAGGMFKPPDTTATKTSHEIHETQFKLMTAVIRKQHHDLVGLRAFVEVLADSHYEEMAEKEIAAREAPRARRRGAPKPRKAHKRPTMPKFHSTVVKDFKHPDFDEALEMDDGELADALASMEAMEAEEAAAEAEAMEADFRQEMQQMEEGPPEGPEGPPDLPF